MKSDRELFEVLPNSIEDWIDVLRLDGAKPHQQPSAAEADFDATGDVAEVLHVDITA